MKKVFLVLAVVVSLAGCSRSQELTSAPDSDSQSTSATEGFLVRDNDVWVQAGDSITWQALYTTYLEAFIRARYPNLKFVTVNSGKSGEVTIQGVIRFRGSMAAWKPTLITSAYGMNDHIKVFGPGLNFVDDSRSAPQRFADEAKKSGARYAVISASPLIQPMENSEAFKAADGSWIAPKERTNWLNKEFADQVKAIAKRNEVPYFDQMTPLLQLWSENYTRDQVAAMRRALNAVIDTPVDGDNWRVKAVLLTNAVKPFLNNAPLVEVWPAPDRENLLARWQGLKSAKAEGYEQFRRYLQEWAKLVDDSTPPFVQVSGYTKSARPVDLIHPNEAGHLQMAGVLFKLFGGDGLVSDVAIDAKTKKVTRSAKATVRDIAAQNETLSFKRLDASLPLPIDPLARPALQMEAKTTLGNANDLFGTSRYLLQVANLDAGEYAVAIDGEEVARATSQELAKGFDLGFADKGPIYDQTQKLLEAVRTGVIMALPEKGQPMVSTDVSPKVLSAALPIERTWTLRRVK